MPFVSPSQLGSPISSFANRISVTLRSRYKGKSDANGQTGLFSAVQPFVCGVLYNNRVMQHLRAGRALAADLRRSKPVLSPNYRHLITRKSRLYTREVRIA